MIRTAGAAQTAQKSEHCMFAESQHSTRCVNRITLDQSAYDMGLLNCWQPIHEVIVIRDRSRIKQVQTVLDLRDRSRIMKAMARKRKNPYAVALGRKGGRKGGPARAANMTPEERSDSARIAVTVRWARAKEQTLARENTRAKGVDSDGRAKN
jgi:hypothetical protein